MTAQGQGSGIAILPASALLPGSSGYFQPVFSTKPAMRIWAFMPRIARKSVLKFFTPHMWAKRISDEQYICNIIFIF